MQNLLKATEEVLKKAGCETPRLDAEVLLAHALGCERYELYTVVSGQLSAISREKFENHVERRKRREPVAYIIGYKEFWSLKIKVTPAVLIPRPETEVLVEKAVQIFGTSAHRHIGTSAQILDLCTGSGCIAAALAKERLETEITAADIFEEALDVARENLKFTGDRITFLQSDLFEKVTGKFDLIVSNPPYIPTEELKTLAPEITRYEPSGALDGGPDGLAFVRRIREEYRNYLKPGGCLILEVGPKIEIWTN